MASVKWSRTLYTTTVRELNAQDTFMLLTLARVNVALIITKVAILTLQQTIDNIKTFEFHR